MWRGEPLHHAVRSDDGRTHLVRAVDEAHEHVAESIAHSRDCVSRVRFAASTRERGVVRKSQLVVRGSRLTFETN